MEGSPVPDVWAKRDLVSRPPVHLAWCDEVLVKVIDIFKDLDVHRAGDGYVVYQADLVG
jgi:hypothetical protein